MRICPRSAKDSDLVLRRFQWMAFDAHSSCSAVGHVLPLVRGAPGSRGLASASRRSLFSAVAWAGRPSRHPGRVCSPDPFDQLRPEPISSPCRAPTHWKRRRTSDFGLNPSLIGVFAIKSESLGGLASDFLPRRRSEGTRRSADGSTGCGLASRPFASLRG